MDEFWMLLQRWLVPFPRNGWRQNVGEILGTRTRTRDLAKKVKTQQLFCFLLQGTLSSVSDSSYQSRACHSPLSAPMAQISSAENHSTGARRAEDIEIFSWHEGRTQVGPQGQLYIIYIKPVLRNKIPGLESNLSHAYWKYWELEVRGIFPVSAYYFLWRFGIRRAVMWIDTAIQQSSQAHEILDCGLLLLWSCTKGSSRYFLSPSPRNKTICGWSAGELIHCQYTGTTGWEDDPGGYQHSPQAHQLLHHRQQPSLTPVQTHPDYCKPKPKLEKRSLLQRFDLHTSTSQALSG